MTPKRTGTEDTGRWGAGWPKVAFVTWHADDQVLEAAASSAKDRYSVKVVPLDAAHSEIERLRGKLAMAQEGLNQAKDLARAEGWEWPIMDYYLARTALQAATDGSHVPTTIERLAEARATLDRIREWLAVNEKSEQPNGPPLKEADLEWVRGFNFCRTGLLALLDSEKGEG